MTAKTCCAVLMDTISIQKYVFASNILRDNLGASHIVKSLFDNPAAESMAEAVGLEKNQVKEIMDCWQKEPGRMLLDDPAIPFEIGAVGGGKALVLFRGCDQAKSFVRSFTRDLLIKAPGLQLAVAIDDKFKLDQDFKSTLESLYSQLRDNRNRYFPMTTIQNHGITAADSNAGNSLNLYSTDVQKFISIEKATKLGAASDEEKSLEEMIEIRHTGYRFTNYMDRLGQIQGNSHIAVVHIDGNNMGQWFADSASLDIYRQRSYNLDLIANESFWALVDEAAEIMSDLVPDNGFYIKDDKAGNRYLPLRPIILGGDDITFLCEGRMGLYFAEKYLQIWTEKANSQLSKYGTPKNGMFSACAGVAIAATKYPFYRTYSIAHELCNEAKKSARNAGGSWIDFHIISGTKSGNLEAVRKDEGIIQGQELHFGPYCLAANHEKSLQYFKEGMWEFIQSWARSDVKELRSVFYYGKEGVEVCLTDMTAKGNYLPYKGRAGVDYSRKGFVDKQTPYFDMLEIMEYYPQFLLKGGNANENGN